MSGTIVTIVLVVLLVAVVLWVIGAYNGLVRIRNLMQESWKQIDVELQRRYDLIPNLVTTVQGYAAHEAETLKAVTEARNLAYDMRSANPGARAEPEGLLSAALGRLIAVSEAYPQLQANTNFLELQRELTDTEDRIAATRRLFNGNVRAMNTSVETFPGSVIANMFGFTRAEYFELEDQEARRAPKVQF